MVQHTLVYWHGIIGIPGKGPNWMEPYEPNKTIGQLIETMSKYNLGEQNKRIEIFKFKPGDMSKYDLHDLYWNHNTTLGEYRSIMDPNGKHVMLIYVNF